MAYAVEVQNIVKKFPPATVAVNDVSFSVEEGEIVEEGEEEGDEELPRSN